MRHELRLFVADSAAAVSLTLRRGPNQRAMPAAVLGWIAAIYLILHVAAMGILPTLPYWRPTDPLDQLHLDGAAAAVLFILMLSAAMIRCVHVMYSRNDLDLLLCSPVPGVTLLRARLGGVVLGTLLLTLFLVSPIIHIGLLTGRPQLLALYPALIAMATIAASCGMMLAIQLARWIGPRRASIVAQVPGTVVIVGLYLLPNLLQAIPAGIKTSFGSLLEDGALLGPASPLWLPVHALQGSPIPLMLFCLAALGLAQLATVLLQHRFLHALQQGRHLTGRTPGRAFGVSLHFGRSLGQLVLYKEWLLILRQPMLLSQFAAKLATLVVAFVAAGTNSLRPLVIAALTVYATGALAGTLTRLIESGEQAWDLLASSPAAPAAIRTAKRWAALIPALLLSLPAPLWLGGADPKLGILTAIALVGASGSANYLSRARALSADKPPPSSSAPILASLQEMLSSGVWIVILTIAHTVL
ncbi:ABC-2 type transport system permease protein [Massilia violacea]|uniref:ABC-2 type transport system permease protein n=2 Tax=Pseudoduganella violacea TaxID=1715466 RepID=A0A7W5B9L5_9BURK|nr:ABC-2 type transport system permease protein [Pseudoduganella violacea]